MFKGIIVGIILTLAAAAGGAYWAIQKGLVPINADDKPSQLETWVAEKSLDATLRREAPKKDNPVAFNEQNLIAGIHLYAEYCAVCHGSAQGSAAPSPIAKGLYQKPPQLASDGVEDDAEGMTFWKVKHGIRLTAMPSFKDSLTDQQIWTLASFLNHMDKLPPAAQQAWQQVQNWTPATPSQPAPK